MATGPILVLGNVTADPGKWPQRPGTEPEETIVPSRAVNQAVAVARLGITTRIVGRLADDDLEQRLLGDLAAEGIDCTWVRVGPNATDETGLVVTPADVDSAEESISQASVCLLQLELPLETIEHAIELCRRHHVETILDPVPFPAQGIPDSLLRADIISPNETEASLLTGLDAVKSPRAVAAALHKRGCRSVVIKLGQHGAYVFSPDGESAVPGFAIQPVDTTAAGDAFTGALAVTRSWGWRLTEGIRFANASGALTCMRMGALPSLPTRAKVEAFLSGQM